jgi:hypothetical protein
MRLRAIAVLIASLALASPARAALILEFLQVNAINAPLSNGPALTSLVIDVGQTTYLQVALRDTLGSGPEFGQPGTLAWNTNGGFAGPGSLGLAVYYMQFDHISGVANIPSPRTNSNNLRLVDLATYALLSSDFAGALPPFFLGLGGAFGSGSEPGAVPDPTHQNRIGLFNLRIKAFGNGTGSFHLRDHNPFSASPDNAILRDADPYGDPNAGALQSIDTLLFSDTGTFPTTKTYDLSVTVVPEPSSMFLAMLAAGGLAWRRKHFGGTCPTAA